MDNKLKNPEIYIILEHELTFTFHPLNYILLIIYHNCQLNRLACDVLSPLFLTNCLSTAELTLHYIMTTKSLF